MSLRSRLLLALATVAAVALLAADLAVYTSLRSFLFNRVDNTLESAHVAIDRVADSSAALSIDESARAAPGTGAGQSGSLSGFCALAAVALIPGSTVEVIAPNGTHVAGGDCSNMPDGAAGYYPALPRNMTSLPTSRSGRDPTIYFTAESAPAGGPPFRVRISRLANGNLLAIAEPLRSTEGTLHRLLLIELLVTGGGLVLAVALGLLLVRAGLRPLREVERTAERITEGELQSRVPGETPKTEVGHVALALNLMLGRIEDAFAQRDATEAELRASQARLKRFVADASHELRTPIAAVSAYAQLFDKARSGHEEDLDRIVQGIARESDRMRRLVEDLLLLARLDEHRPLRMDPVELVELVTESVHTATTVGPSWPVRLVAPRPIEVVGDEVRLRQVIDNLLANVRAHTPPGTATTVRLDEESDEAVLTVSDEGPGIDPGIAEQVFGRFVRADPSRARTSPSEGAGLGLAIVASIVEAHHGTVTLGRAPGTGPGRPAGPETTAPGPPGTSPLGTVIRVRLPLAAGAPGNR